MTSLEKKHHSRRHLTKSMEQFNKQNKHCEWVFKLNLPQRDNKTKDDLYSQSSYAEEDRENKVNLILLK